MEQLTFDDLPREVSEIKKTLKILLQQTALPFDRFDAVYRSHLQIGRSDEQARRAAMIEVALSYSRSFASLYDQATALRKENEQLRNAVALKSLVQEII